MPKIIPIIILSFGFLFLFGLALDIALEKEAYRLQIVCEKEISQGYRIAPCNYYQGEQRP